MDKHICTITFTYRGQFIYQKLTSEHQDMMIDEALSYCIKNFDELGVKLDQTGEVHVYKTDGLLLYNAQNLLGIALLINGRGVKN